MIILMSVCYIVFAVYLSDVIPLKNREYTRKLSHVVAACWWFIAALFFPYERYLFLVPILTYIIVSIILKLNKNQGIKRDDGKKEYGVICYFLGMLVLILPAYLQKNNIAVYGIFFIPLGFGDAAAAIIGSTFARKKYSVFGAKKSYIGSLAMFFMSLFMCFVYNWLFCNYSFIHLIFISVISTILEAISIKGTDNLTIPLGTMLLFNLINF